MSELTHNQREQMTPSLQTELDDQDKLLISHVLELVAIAFSKKHDVGGPFDQLNVTELRQLARYMLALLHRNKISNPGFFYSQTVKYEFLCQTVKVGTVDGERNCHLTFFAKAQALEKVYMTDGLNLHKRVALLMLRDKIRQHRVEKLVVGEHSVNMFAFYNTLTYCDASDREYPVDMFMIVGPHGLNQEELEHTVSCYCKRELLHFETVGTKGPYVDYYSNEDAYYFFIEKRGMAQFRKTNIDQLVSLFK